MAKNQNNSDEQYTKEATFGTLPVRKSERQYGMLDAFLVLSGYGVDTESLHGVIHRELFRQPIATLNNY